MASEPGKDTAKCANCYTTGNLKTCAKCKSQQYCSRECQKAHWKEHRKVCGINSTTMPNNPSAPSSILPHTFDPLTWLHDRPEKNVYELLVDAFRLLQLEGNTIVPLRFPPGFSDDYYGFNHFLRFAEAKENLLPSWWCQEKAKACIALGMGHSWFSLGTHPSELEIANYYGDSNVVPQLKALGECAYGLVTPEASVPSAPSDASPPIRSGTGIWGMSLNGQHMIAEYFPDGSLKMVVPKHV